LAEEHLPESGDASSRANRLRQRLVGAAVLIALAVLLLPIWLDGSGLRAPRVEPVPPTPKVSQPKAVTVPQPTPKQQSELQHPPRALMPPPQSSAAASDSDTARAPASQAQQTAPEPEKKPAPETQPEPAKADKTPASPKPAPKPAGKPESKTESKAPSKALPATSADGKWVVQLGSFSDELNARGLEKSVKEAGFKVYVEPLFAKKGTVWRVRVGPFATRDEASKATEHLRERLGRDGLVMAK